MFEELCVPAILKQDADLNTLLWAFTLAIFYSEFQTVYMSLSVNNAIWVVRFVDFSECIFFRV